MKNMDEKSLRNTYGGENGDFCNALAGAIGVSALLGLYGVATIGGITYLIAC